MPTATQPHTTPTRRSAIGFSLAAMAAGLTVPAIASAAAPNPDAELIALSDQFLTVRTEFVLLMDHDEWASDFGPNHARYQLLDAEESRLFDLVSESPSPTSADGLTALARVALTWLTRDLEGNAQCTDCGERMLVELAESVAAGFVWPPRPGDCSTARWAPPASAKEIAEHAAARDAETAAAVAKFQTAQEAKREAAIEAVRQSNRAETMTDDDLMSRLQPSRQMMEIAQNMHGEYTAEMARRGLTA